MSLSYVIKCPQELVTTSGLVPELVKRHPGRGQIGPEGSTHVVVARRSKRKER